MTAKEFVKAYETALASQDWKMVEPLIAANASVTFSNGAVHVGKKQVQKAFEHNFETIKSEAYAMDQINWLAQEDTFAVYTFEFNWKGMVRGALMSGSGVGTSVIVRVGEKWKLLTEHLVRKS